MCKFSILASASTSKQPSSSTWVGPGTEGVKQETVSLNPPPPPCDTQAAQAGLGGGHSPGPLPPSLGGWAQRPSPGAQAGAGSLTVCHTLLSVSRNSSARPAS